VGARPTVEPSALELLVSGYLNQDWPEDFATVWDAVDTFRSDEGPDTAAAARGEVTSLLAAAHSDDDLRHLLVEQLGCGYWPPGDGLTLADGWSCSRTAWPDPTLQAARLPADRSGRVRSQAKPLCRTTRCRRRAVGTASCADWNGW
jgi:hypothetical protein